MSLRKSIAELKALQKSEQRQFEQLLQNFQSIETSLNASIHHRQRVVTMLEQVPDVEDVLVKECDALQKLKTEMEQFILKRNMCIETQNRNSNRIREELTILYEALNK